VVYRTIIIMSREHESEGDIDIYGDLPNFPSSGDTVKEVSIERNTPMLDQAPHR
jgi:hypothetical protein